MKTVKTLLFVLFALNSIHLFAQSDSTKKLKYVSLDAYLYGNTPILMNLTSITQLSKGDNDLLKKDISTFKENYGYNRNFSAGINVNAGLSLIKEAPNQITRLSFGLNTYSLAMSNYINDSTWFLQHVHSTSSLYNSFDIVKEKVTSIYHSYDLTCLNFSGAQLFYTKRERFLSAYVGISATASFSVSSKIRSEYFTYEGAKMQDSITGNYSSFPRSSYKPQNHAAKISNAKMAGIVSVGLPLGFEMRFSKTRKRLKHFSLAMEIMPQYNYTITPKLSKQGYWSFRTTPINFIYRF